MVIHERKSAIAGNHSALLCLRAELNRTIIANSMVFLLFQTTATKEPFSCHVDNDHMVSSDSTINLGGLSTHAPQVHGNSLEDLGKIQSNVTFTADQDLAQHPRIVIHGETFQVQQKNHNCIFCGDAFVSRLGLGVHMENRHDRQLCNVCNIPFKCHELAQHVAGQIHKNALKVESARVQLPTSEICSSSFASKSSSDTQIIRLPLTQSRPEAGSGPFISHQKPVVTTESTSWQTTAVTSTTPVFYSCDLCGEEYDSVAPLLEHMRSVHASDYNPTIVANVNIEDEKPGPLQSQDSGLYYECPHCSLLFQCNLSRAQHIRRHCKGVHGSINHNTARGNSSKKQAIPTISGEQTVDPLLEQMPSDHNPTIVVNVNLKDKKPGPLQNQKSDLSYKCPNCSLSFSSYPSRAQHIRRVRCKGIIAPINNNTAKGNNSKEQAIASTSGKQTTTSEDQPSIVDDNRCSCCGLTFQSLVQLEEHCNEIHNQLKVDEVRSLELPSKRPHTKARKDAEVKVRLKLSYIM